jgi:hypothetical protein
MKDAVATMGDILPDDVSGRDAVHVAVVSAEAGDKLTPGQDVGFSGELSERGEQIAKAALLTVDPIGIVDPFLKGLVWPKQRFWLYLYPRTITSLRHQWTHPAFSDDPGSAYSPPSQKLASEQWLRSFIDRSDCPDYDTVIAAATGNHAKNDEGDNYTYSRNDGEYLFFGGRDAHGEIPDEFWDHIEIVTGQKIERGQRATYFSCSC